VVLYLAYATSFITIGGIWVAHHGVFRRLAYANQRLMVVNPLLLMAVSFLPFPTKLMAEAIHNEDAARPSAHLELPLLDAQVASPISTRRPLASARHR
jgi:uncharacterized membrane protein